MKQFFKPIPLILLGFSLWITWVCASLLEFDYAGNLTAHSYSIWGDWSVHFTFITALQERGFSWISGDNPLFPGAPFQYPFLSHVLTYFFSAITRLDVIRATYVLSLILIFILPYTLYRTFMRLGVNGFSAALGTLCFLLVGGFQWMDSSVNAPFTNQFDQASIFTQFILFEFFPQRAFLFGILIFSGLLIYAHKQKVWNWKNASLVGLACALLALLHVHTWVAMGTYLIGILLFPPRPVLEVSRKRIFFFGLAVAGVSAVFLAFLLLRENHSGSQGTWELWFPGWAQNPKANLAKAQEMNFLSFWIFNTGLYLPLAGAGIALKRKDSRYQALAFSGLFLFIISILFNIQPYFYDNLKLFTYSFYFLAPFVGIALFSLSEIKWVPRWAGISLALVLTLLQTHAATRDLLAFQGGLQNAGFFSSEEFKMANQFKAVRKSADDIVAINPKHNHWIPCLTGNPVMMGYPGWLWSWGINYNSRDAQVHEILRGGPNAEATIKSNQVAYIAVQNGEKFGNEAVNFAYLDSHFKKVLSDRSWQVYSTRDVISPTSSVR